MSEIAAVIPTRTFAYADRLLLSMEASEPGSARSAILVDTGMDPHVSVPFGMDWKAVNAGVRVCDPMTGHVRARDYLERVYGCRIVDDTAADAFVYARACNAGARAAGPDAHLLMLNDDTEIVSKHWLTTLDGLVAGAFSDDMGLVSCAILPGGVGNRQQEFSETFKECGHYFNADKRLRVVDGTVCFVACAIPKWVWRGVIGGTAGYAIGLDERFVGYGFEDDDYTRRVRRMGYQCFVSDAVVVRHVGTGALPMHGTFSRFSREAHGAMFAHNQALYAAKWEGERA